MLNKAILQGRLVADPELRHTQSGTAVATFRIACDRDYKSKDPNAQNADFINIVAWRNTAEFISRYFTKGSMILIDGRIQTRDYTDNNGQRRYVTEVVADNVNFAGSKRESGGASASGYGQQNNYGGNAGGYGSYGGYNANNQAPAQPSYAAPAAYAPTGLGQAPANEFAELNDDDGELPF
ncbi:MAG: single-stranded DNA-binding protein [Oscillospiraceae bacterium]|nr:single-stranded DNA-binding protein [Oscillospiraceae bacterium]